MLFQALRDGGTQWRCAAPPLHGLEIHHPLFQSWNPPLLRQIWMPESYQQYHTESTSSHVGSLIKDLVLEAVIEDHALPFLPSRPLLANSNLRAFWADQPQVTRQARVAGCTMWEQPGSRMQRRYDDFSSPDPCHLNRTGDQLLQQRTSLGKDLGAFPSASTTKEHAFTPHSTKSDYLGILLCSTSFSDFAEDLHNVAVRFWQHCFQLGLDLRESIFKRFHPREVRLLPERLGPQLLSKDWWSLVGMLPHGTCFDRLPGDEARLLEAPLALEQEAQLQVRKPILRVGRYRLSKTLFCLLKAPMVHPKCTHEAMPTSDLCVGIRTLV
mmetsp:Transcript_37337/g.79241  ORF Transcript_37337/g.79241 Transcript_37337/m.79241 type:complete len:326 (-) Transcript_37337:269-1246(-)